MPPAKKVKDSSSDEIRNKQGEVPASTVEHKGAKFPDSVTGTGRFEVVVIGDEGRVYGKQGQPVSAILSSADADDLCRRSNRLDPERQSVKGE